MMSNMVDLGYAAWLCEVDGMLRAFLRLDHHMFFRYPWRTVYDAGLPADYAVQEVLTAYEEGWPG